METLGVIMMKNNVVEILEKVVGTNYLPFISGEVKNPGTNDCALTVGRGSVYGFAVKVGDGQKSELFDRINKRGIKESEWKSIGDDYYPLYWGKDINMGARLHSHTKASKSTGTIQLNRIPALIDQEIIYGAIPCSNSADIEKRLQQMYPYVLKTTILKEDEGVEQLTIVELSPDESPDESPAN